MFTGLIQSLSKVSKVSFQDGSLRLVIEAPSEWADFQLGESIAVDGVCLTLEDFSQNELTFYVSPETIQKTCLDQKNSGSFVNLERSLRVGDRLGGHMVSGHVDGTAQVTEVRDEGEALWLKIALNDEFFLYVIKKGSIAINGVSLTINDIDKMSKSILLCLIPETLARTNLKDLKVGVRVNVECDQMVKMIQNVITQRRELGL